MEEHVLSMAEIEAEDGVEYATIPGFKEGQVFRIASLTAGDMIEWSEANEGEAKRTAGLRLIVKSLVDESGKHIATDAHIATFRKKTHKVTEAIVKAILKHNGMSVKQDAEAKKD
jgi:hypothetical protein